MPSPTMRAGMASTVGALATTVYEPPSAALTLPVYAGVPSGIFL